MTKTRKPQSNLSKLRYYVALRFDGIEPVRVPRNRLGKKQDREVPETPRYSPTIDRTLSHEEALEIYRLSVKPNKSVDDLRSMVELLKLDAAIPEIGLIPPGWVHKPAEWTRAVLAEASAQYWTRMLALFDDTDTRGGGGSFVASESAVAKFAGVGRKTIGQDWRKRPAYIEAVAQVVRYLEEQDQQDIKTLAEEAGSGLFDPDER